MSTTEPHGNKDYDPVALFTDIKTVRANYLAALAQIESAAKHDQDGDVLDNELLGKRLIFLDIRALLRTHSCSFREMNQSPAHRRDFLWSCICLIAAMNRFDLSLLSRIGSSDAHKIEAFQLLDEIERVRSLIDQAWSDLFEAFQHTIEVDSDVP